LAKISIIQTEATVSQTLADLRKLFREWSIEDWEPIPDEDRRSYTVRYLRGSQWTAISSQMQPTKAMNLRVCYQVIMYLKLWENRGVTGVAKGVTFVGAMVPVGNPDKEDFEQSCAIVGVEPSATLEEIERIYQVKVQYVHPDKFNNRPESERREAEDRFKRLKKAYEIKQWVIDHHTSLGRLIERMKREKEKEIDAKSE